MRKKFMRFFILAMLCVLPGRVAAEEIGLTLDEAVTIALGDNRAVLMKAQELKRAKALIAEASALLFPQVSAAGSWTETRSLYRKDIGTYSGRIGVSQLLYKGGQVINAIKIGEFNYTATQAALDAARRDLIFAVRQAYYTLWFSEKFVALNSRIRDNTLEHVRLTQARFDRGEASESEMIGMRSALAGVTQAAEASRNQYAAAQALLSSLLFLDADTKVRPQGDFAYEPKGIAYEQAFLDAMRQRPELRQVDAQLSIARKNAEVARSDARPAVYASWDYYSSSRAGGGIVVTPTPIKNSNDYNVIGITVSWPVFDGWMTKARVDQAMVNIEQARLLKEKTVQDIALELKDGFLALQDALEKTRSAAAQVAVYQDTLEVIQRKYNSGSASELDLHDGRLRYDVALFNQVQVLYEYLVAQARFDRATGGSQ